MAASKCGVNTVTGTGTASVTWIFGSGPIPNVNSVGKDAYDDAVKKVKALPAATCTGKCKYRTSYSVSYSPAQIVISSAGGMGVKPGIKWTATVTYTVSWTCQDRIAIRVPDDLIKKLRQLAGNP